MYVLKYVSYQGGNIQLDETGQICKQSQIHFLLWPWQNTSCQCLAILWRVSNISLTDSGPPTRDLRTVLGLVFMGQKLWHSRSVWNEIRKPFLFENAFPLPFSDYLKFFSTFKNDRAEKINLEFSCVVITGRTFDSEDDSFINLEVWF